MDDTFLIHVQFEGYKLPLRIPRKDEELYRDAEKLIKKYLEVYLKRYSQRPFEEILIYLTYHFAVSIIKVDANEDVEPIAKKISELDEELKQLLNEK